MLTREKIVAEVSAVEKKRLSWEASSDASLLIAWRGIGVKAISEKLLNAMVDLIRLCDTSDIETPGQPIALAVDDFAVELEKWMRELEQFPETTSPNGSTHFAMWDRWAAVVTEAKEPMRFAKPEPIQALVAQKVPPRQIAKMYGWFTNGEPDLQRVQEEITNPGTHYKPSEWKGPRELRYWADVSARWAVRAAKIGEQVAKDAERKARQEAPESVEELIRQRVPSKQIARMKGVPMEQVRALAAEMGVAIDGQVLPRNRAEADAEALAEAENALNTDTHEELDGKEARVLAMLADGMKPGEVAKALQSAYPGLSVQAVSAIARAEAAKTPAS